MKIAIAVAVAVLAAVCAVAVALPAAKTYHLHASEQEDADLLTTKLHLKSFSFKDCGGSSAIGHISALNISPDPIRLPGNVTFNLAASLSAQVASPIKAELTLEKKVGIWVKIPCLDNIGSCTYDDLCTLLEKIPLTPDGKCPDPLPQYGVPCRCPLTPFNVNVPSTTVAAPALPPDVPSWLSNGDYKATIKATTSGGATMICADLELSLKT